MIAPILEVADARALPLRSESVGLIATSPPYALDVGYPQGDVAPDAWPAFMRACLAEALRVAEPSGRLCLNVPFDVARPEPRPTYAIAVQAAREVGWRYRTLIVWNEDNVTRTTARGSVDSPSSPYVITRAEAVVVLFKPPRWKRPRPAGVASDLTRAEWLAWTNGLWTFPGASAKRTGHPAPFPEELPRRLIKLFSWPGDTVLDPMMGSGTACRVAHRHGRRAIGFDVAAEYVELARRTLGEGKGAAA